MTTERVAGSYRDRKGHVFVSGDRILRSVSGDAIEVQREFLASPVFERLVSRGRLVGTSIAPDEPKALGLASSTLLLEHERIPFDIFDDYTEDRFRDHLAAHARIVDELEVSGEGRLLIRYERSP